MIHRIQQYQLPLILLRKETPKEAVCQVFEKVNTGGVSLTVFELLTATFAADEYNLARGLGHPASDSSSTRSWRGREHRLPPRSNPTRHPGPSCPVPRGGASLSEHAPGINCKRREILRLTVDDYRRGRTQGHAASRGLASSLSAKYLLTARDVPYRTQVAPLAAILAVLGERPTRMASEPRSPDGTGAESSGNCDGVIRDAVRQGLPEVPAWLRVRPEPTTMTEANFPPGAF